MVEVKDLVLDKLDVGPVPVRVYQGSDCTKSPPVLLYFSGGAFMQSGLEDCPVAACLAATGAIVVVPGYNATLGSAFPKPLEVGFSVFTYLAKKRAGLGDRRSLLIVGGVESGGNIAAAVALKARDHLSNELDGQVLASPLLDPFMGSASSRKSADIGMRRIWEDGWSQYLSAGICHPYAAPWICSRLFGVAPALILSSKDDPLLDESLGYARHLRDAGVRVRQEILPSGTGWPSIYGGKTPEASTWHENASRQFSSFVGELRHH